MRGTSGVLVNGRARLLVALASLVVALIAPAASAQAGSYVSLGDSFTAGPLIPVQIQPFGCLKSSSNYSHLAALELGRELRDPSCSGADTKDMTEPQGVTPGPNPPQFDSLGPDTTDVTVGIGGNDIGFSSIAQDCLSFTREGSPCKDMYVVNGRDEVSERIAATAPKVAAVLDGIHARSPSAQVFVVNYAAIFPETGDGCYPQMPVASGDVPWLREKQKELNAMLAGEAAADGSGLIDWYTASIGHDACQPPVIRWVEPVVPVNAAAPVHPNLGGMMGASGLVKTAIGAD